METHAFFLSMLWKKVRLRRAGRGGVVGGVSGKRPLTSEQLQNPPVVQPRRGCGQGQVIGPSSSNKSVQ